LKAWCFVRGRCFLFRTPVTTALLARRFWARDETRRVAGAGRFQRATGCRATECKSRAPVNELPARPPGKRHAIADNGTSGMGYCCGVGWGGSVHAVCIIDDIDVHIVARFTIDHTAEGLAELRGSVRSQGSLPRTPPADRFSGPRFERSRVSPWTARIANRRQPPSGRAERSMASGVSGAGSAGGATMNGLAQC